MTELYLRGRATSPRDRNADIYWIHPDFRNPVNVAEQLGFYPFEGLRSPERQAMLFARGRTAPGRIVTNAEPWESLHQYGLAVDFTGLTRDGKPSWDAKLPWAKLEKAMRAFGLHPIKGERPHYQLCGLRDARAGRFRRDGANVAYWLQRLGTLTALVHDPMAPRWMTGR